MVNVITETLQFKFTDFCTDKIYHYRISTQNHAETRVYHNEYIDWSLSPVRMQ